MTKTNPDAAAMTSSQVLILYGFDEDAKPHAGKFSISQKETALKAAEAMHFKAHEADGTAFAEILAKIPAGRLYSNGRGFVPFARRDRFAKLMAALGLPDPTDDPNVTPAVAQGFPADWASISVGHMVIAHDGHDGWYEAIVIAVDGDMLTLRFRDYPHQQEFVRPLKAVALLSSDAA